MGFEKVRELVDASYMDGKYWLSPYRKTPSVSSAAGSVVDLSMSAGNPRPNYYSGTALTATLLNTSYGIWHGGDVSPATKHLHKVMAMCVSTTTVPANMWLLDYLLFYPLIDMDSTTEQVFDNPVTLPRYTDGKGVQAFVVATNPYIGGAQFYINYTNQDGVSGKISPIAISNTLTFISTLIHSASGAGIKGAFLELAPGDAGIRSVESITFVSPSGGLAALVLCKPLANFFFRETNAPAEWDYLLMKPNLPRIYDGAYLNFIISPNGSIAAFSINGMLEFVWN